MRWAHVDNPQDYVPPQNKERVGNHVPKERQTRNLEEGKLRPGCNWVSNL